MSDPLALPGRPFETYIPDAENPFDSKRLNHLLRRTAFAPNATLREQFANKNPSDVLDWLFNYDAESDPIDNALEDLHAGLPPFNKPEAAQRWWVFRLLKNYGKSQSRPFQERIALFWHNNFAASLSKDDGAMALRMHNQIELFRRLGLANFRDLLTQVGRDPAMLVWLDGKDNRKGKPNENYGREVMELFTLGIGNYTETDVKEVARAYTGWQIRGEKGELDSKLFDDGEKTIFGKTGKFNDEAVVDLLLNHPACAKHIAWKMLKEFVHPNPGQEIIDHYAARLVDLKWEIKPVLREMLCSRLFFSDYAYRSKIKGPIELVTGATLFMAAMGGEANIDFALAQMIALGQPPMMPPSVKGWDGEQAWINANTLFLRYNFANKIVIQNNKEFVKKSDIKSYLDKHNLATADQVIDHFADLLHDGALPPGLRDNLLAFMTLTVKGKPAPFVVTADSVHSKVRNVIHIMMATPEYQLS